MGESAASVLALSQFYPEVARLCIEIAAAPGKNEILLGRKAKQLIDRPTQPMDVVVGADLNVALLKRTRSHLEDFINTTDSPEQRELGKKRVDEISGEIQKNTERREKTLRENPQLLKERPELEKVSTIESFAAAMGTDLNLAYENPIGAILEKLTPAMQDKKAWDDLIVNLRNAGIKEEDLENMTRFRSHAKVEETTKKYGKRGAVAVAGVGLLGLLMAWMAAKSVTRESQGGAGRF